jgi:hypothetical protein
LDVQQVWSIAVAELDLKNAEVPVDVIPPGSLPPLKYRDLPEPPAFWKMAGPSIILAGLALGSGEFVLWPYITFKSQFVFFWACLLGVTTQYFINMEITRWSLATGETAVGGFVRLNRHFAWIFLILNVVPWMIPAWAKGAAQLLSWLIWGPHINAATGAVTGTPYDTEIAIGGMFFCGLVLTAGPVIYETIEKVQMFLVSLVMLLVILISVWLLKDRPDAIAAQATAVLTLGAPQFLPAFDSDLTTATLLGALAFAGAGGTMNLGQSNYIRDKGYGMGHYIGRITSPLTGQQEAITEVGYHFPDNEANRRRWKAWWRAASLEHFVSFFLTCVICLVLLSLLSYVLFFDRQGNPIPSAAQFGNDISFIWGEATRLEELVGGVAKVLFLVMGVAILLTTEFGVLDACSRVSTDIVKVCWLRQSQKWSESRLYFMFLWGTILVGSAILLAAKFGVDVGAMRLFKLTAAMNGGVMFVYSAALLYMNKWRLPANVRMSNWRMAIMAWSVLFFGFFAIWAVLTWVLPSA